MYALRKGGAATAIAANNGSVRSNHARKALRLARHYSAARVPEAVRALWGSFHSARMGGNGTKNGPRRRPLEPSSSSYFAAAASSLPFSQGMGGVPAWACAGRGTGRGMASWTSPDAQRFGAVVAGERTKLRVKRVAERVVVNRVVVDRIVPERAVAERVE